MVKVLKFIGIVVLLFFVIVFFYKDTIIRLAAEKVGSKELGAKLTIKHFSWNVYNGDIRIRNITIGHPPGYETGVFADIPSIEVRYDLRALFSGRWHFPLVVIDLKEMTAIKNSEGKLNVDEFKLLHAPKAKDTEESRAENKVVPKFLIDELKLNVGQVVFKDHFKKDPPKILVYDINIKDRVVKNIDSAPKLVAAVILQAVKKTAIQGAGIYAAGIVMGAGFLPGAVLGVIVADDDATKVFDKGYDAVFDHCYRFMKEHGKITKFDRAQAFIDGKVDGVDLKMELKKLSWFKTQVKVTARKFMLPKPEFAGGILYQIDQAW